MNGNCTHLVIPQPECGIHNALHVLAHKTRLDSDFRRNDGRAVTVNDYFYHSKTLHHDKKLK